MNYPGQVENFVDQTADIEPPDLNAADGEDAPLIPFPTSYRLTGSQERALVDHAMTRLRELEDELGRERVRTEDWYTGGQTEDIRSFMEKRQLYSMMYRNDVRWRPFMLGGIFNDSNLVVPLARRITRQMVARANNYFFGTEPWFAVYPVGLSDRDLAKDIERYTTFVFDQSNQKKAMESAVERAFVLGESIVKTTYEVREQLYEQQGNVLVDAKGRDILAADGDYIFDTDLWVAETESEVDPNTGEPLPPVPTGRMVLKRDGATPQPDNPIFAGKLVTRKLTLFKGAESNTVYFKDFLCPLTAEDIQKADFIAHLYDMPVMHLADQYRRRDLLNTGNEQQRENTRKAIEAIRNMASESGQPKAAAGQPRADAGERTDLVTVGNADNPLVEIAECHLRYDANGDGIMEDIMLVLDRRNRTPIFYDYEANVTPDGQRPFDVITANRVDGRWHGMGAFEMFESSQETVDLLVNRWNFSQSASGRIDIFSPHNTMEGDTNKDFKINWGKTVTPKPGKKAEDIVESVYLNDVKFDKLKDMFEFFLQMATNESGVANANDSRLAGLDTGKLATGIRNIEKSGQEMFALYLSQLEPCLQSCIKRSLNLIFANLDQDEVFSFFEGDQQSLGMIRQQDVKDLRLNVNLLLTRYRGEQLLQSSMQAEELVAKFYAYPIGLQNTVAPLYRDMLRALQIPFGDQVIVPGMASTTPAAPGQPDVNAARAAITQNRPPGVATPNL